MSYATPTWVIFRARRKNFEAFKNQVALLNDTVREAGNIGFNLFKEIECGLRIFRRKKNGKSYFYNRNLYYNLDYFLHLIILIEKLVQLL